MKSLAPFHQPIEIARKPIGNQYKKAYKMDSTDETRDMRKNVDMGTCHCCDYFLIDGNAIILIEETQLSRKERELRNTYGHLKKTPRNQMVKKQVREEIALKIYGTMLVLCRLAAKHPDVNSGIKSKKYSLWIVNSNSQPGTRRQRANLRSSENLITTNSIKSNLGGRWFGDVKVISPDILKKGLS